MNNTKEPYLILTKNTHGKYTSATNITATTEEDALNQINQLLRTTHKKYKNSTIIVRQNKTNTIEITPLQEENEK